MTTNNKLIQVDELEFSGIKNNIKAFLRGQTQYSDYNFEGSAMSTLLDVLAYSTHMNALYTNLAINESFLDSASKYSSVVSLAKSIGYTAKSRQSSRARLQVVVTDVPGNPTVLTIPKATGFRSDRNGITYNFFTLTSSTSPNVANSYTFNIEVVEGTRLTTSYQAQSVTQYVMPNPGIDLSTLSVTVQENSTTSLLTQYSLVDDLLKVKGVDTVYFLKQREDLFYEVYFGNDVIGKSIIPGNMVFLEYMTSNGSITNGCGNFYYASGWRSDVLFSITTIEKSVGGADEESIDSIKFNAPRTYVSQNRAVTVDDYKNQVLSNFPQVESISVWGGQDNDPPQYGKVFLSAKPFGRNALNSTEKKEIKKFIANNRSVVSIQQEFVDPIILTIGMNVNVYFNDQNSTKSAGELQSLIQTTIKDYSNTLNTFDSSFRFSKLSRLIDTTEGSIISNISSIFLRRTISPIFGIAQNYKLLIGNPIATQDSSVRSTKFNIPTVDNKVFLASDSTGNLVLKNIALDGTESFRSIVGSVDFINGKILISNLTISSLAEADFTFTIIPSSNDVIPTRQNIIVLDNSLALVTMIPESNNHIFTSSR